MMIIVCVNRYIIAIVNINEVFINQIVNIKKGFLSEK